MSEPWIYPSVVGMVLYLSNNTQPDITVAVSQVARFTHTPKQSQLSAVKRIIRYLKGTINNGTIFRVPKKLSLDCFVDANFCGLYNIDPPDMTSSVRSCADYIIKFCGYPLIWKSQLMDCICLSTAEAEYYAFSQAMRALIPVRTLLKEMCLSLNVPEFTNPDSILTTVHEDNQSALCLATEQRITSRTRFYLARYHFFWEHVRNRDISVIYCPTESQEADYLTKNLPEKDFKVGNETVHWCGKCVKRNLSDGSGNTIKGRWTNGGSKHFTDEHHGSQHRQGPCGGGGGRGDGGRGGNHNRANLANNTPTPSAPGTVASETNDVVTNLRAALADSDVNGCQPGSAMLQCKHFGVMICLGSLFHLHIFTCHSVLGLLPALFISIHILKL
ncbi:hypothetical protein CTEN210_18673 [Chaetoceros tenuissimus]|uniref:Reverse transcriptase Ty1/copia-type domain-containing protein n=1 Tax=Chaetoceros tenuissimus TaxID=426638 RepID=A0AAD3DDZ4_9STRA|nr:hypothetical protein CTEN210_18673 [Chaetoceros tenuissimus]